MLWLKVTVPSIVLIGAVIQYLIDYIWHDKRTKRHRRARLALFVFIVIAGTATVGLVVLDHISSEDQQNTLNQLREEQRNANNAANQREQGAKRERAALEAQIESLEIKLEPFTKIAQSKYPDQSADDALAKLADEMKSIKDATNKIRRTIRDFLVSVQMILTGDWSNGLSFGREVPVILPTNPYVVFTHTSHISEKTIKCLPTRIERERMENDTVKVYIEATVKPGGWPLGTTLDNLEGYDRCEIAIAMIDKRKVIGQKITLQRNELQVFINGEPKMRRVDEPHASISLPASGLRILRMDGYDLLASARD